MNICFQEERLRAHTARVSVQNARGLGGAKRQVTHLGKSIYVLWGEESKTKPADWRTSGVPRSLRFWNGRSSMEPGGSTHGREA